MTGAVSNDMLTAIEDVVSAETSCILAPYVNDGPFYIVGEYLRSNVKEPHFCDGIDVFPEV
ncbi:uncharacterized protein BCR38DRAFT_442154 [Pseudomassariella vexata]|uniref:Uncharacterized protein n=1 Tax=Pseudomassariella vexata TaxID=1141098 RepID=A0A1Y2DNH6_9PEZI|nr:uncharacterized protein BCR38DRAFT_442154 [Pseudomassariella vexata]ORY60686.1 hypothetical protein BCR38DRAFT_442154 [Pseudomassariella vexata]